MKKIFLILKFIQNANLNGQTLYYKDFPLEKLNLNNNQLDFYLKTLFEDGYIKGVSLIPTTEEKVELKLDNLTITTKGLEYLEENLTMKKYKNSLKKEKIFFYFS